MTRNPLRLLLEQLRHMVRHPLLYAPLLGIWVLAELRLFVDPTPHVPLLVNWTPSLPYHLAWLRRDKLPPKRGDYVVYAFDGGARHDWPGLAGQPFFKIVRGLPGDTVSVDDRIVAVNGEPVGRAKTHTLDRRPLDPIEPTTIPPGHYYVQGTSVDAFDSRYRASGLVRLEQMLGTVVPLF
jgi:conjugal transfer pilin signal peptidase TrbI